MRRNEGVTPYWITEGSFQDEKPKEQDEEEEDAKDFEDQVPAGVIGSTGLDPTNVFYGSVAVNLLTIFKVSIGKQPH